MGDTSLRVGGMVPTKLNAGRDGLESVVTDRHDRIATVTDATVTGLPGQSGPVSGLRLVVGSAKPDNTHEGATYFFDQRGAAYRFAHAAGCSPSWVAVSDPREIEAVEQALAVLRPSGADTMSNVAPAAPGASPLQPYLAALRAPNGPSAKASQPPSAPGTSTDGRFVFEDLSDLQRGNVSFSSKWATMTARVDISADFPAGSKLSVDPSGKVEAQRPNGKWVSLGATRPERIEALRYAWARYPLFYPEAYETARLARLPARSTLSVFAKVDSSAPPLDYVTMQERLATLDSHK